VALDHGLFSAEGLAVSTNIANGSPDAIARVASDASDLALVDINELIRFRDQANAPPVKAIFVLFNKSPYAFVARKSRGIHALSDLQGKTVGVADSDFSIRMWPALARQNGIKLASVKLNRISAAVREPILSAGQVDAVAAFSYLAAVNLRDRGVPASDLAVLKYADYGCEAYGFAVIVNPAFATAKPEAVKGFVRALIAGTHLTIADPARAVDAVVRRLHNGARDPVRRSTGDIGTDGEPLRAEQAMVQRHHKRGRACFERTVEGELDRDRLLGFLGRRSNAGQNHQARERGQ